MSNFKIGEYLNCKSEYLQLRNNFSIQKGGNKPSAQVLADEIHFWGHQMTEHCEFLQTETKDPKFSEDAAKLQSEFKKYMKDVFADINPEKIELDQSDYEKIAGGNYAVEENHLRLTTLNELLRKLRELKNKVKQSMRKDWIGFTFPAEIDHMLKELDHFEKNIRGDITPEEIAKFYAEEAAEHTMLAHKLLNPYPLYDADEIDEETKKASDETKQCAKKIQKIDKENVKNSLDYVNELTKAGAELEEKVNAHRVKHIINSKLIAHEGRESKRGIAVMNKLKIGSK